MRKHHMQLIAACQEANLTPAQKVKLFGSFLASEEAEQISRAISRAKCNTHDIIDALREYGIDEDEETTKLRVG